MFKRLIIAALVLMLAGCVQVTEEYLRATPYERAVLLYQNGWLFQAKMMAESVSEDDPGYRSARRLLKEIDTMMLKVARRHMELGEDFEKAGVYPSALKEYRTSLAYNPSNAFVKKKVQVLAEAVKEGVKPDVEKDIAKVNDARKSNKSKKEDPEELANTHYMKGKIYYESKVYQKAIEEFDTVLRIIPTYMDARKLLMQVRKERDDAVDLHLKRGIAFFQKEEMEMAINEWNAVLELDPGNMTATDYKARAEVILDRLERIRERQAAEQPF